MKKRGGKKKQKVRATDRRRGQSLNQELLDHIRLEIHGAPLLSFSPFTPFHSPSFPPPLDFVWPLIELYH